MNNTEDHLHQNKLGWTPCHYAAAWGNLKVFEFILEHLVDKNPPSTKGPNLGLTPLHLAAQEGHVSICRVILKYVIEKNPQKEDRVTPLHSAACYGRLEACKLLLEEAHDKEPTVVNTVGTALTPAFLAKYNNHDKVFEYITEYLRKNDLPRNDG